MFLDPKQCRLMTGGRTSFLYWNHELNRYSNDNGDGTLTVWVALAASALRSFEPWPCCVLTRERNGASEYVVILDLPHSSPEGTDEIEKLKKEIAEFEDVLRINGELVLAGIPNALDGYDIVTEPQVKEGGEVS